MSNTPTTPEIEQRLREIEERYSNSTEGLWVARKIILMESYVILPNEDTGTPIAKDMLNGMDCSFMAHAHQDIPFLLSALREVLADKEKFESALHESNEECRSMHKAFRREQDAADMNRSLKEKSQQSLTEIHAELAQALAEVERLKERAKRYE